ncbi:MAG: tetratricopeptide repeat protein [Pyrinomonadaceae bacterium]
MRHLIVLFCIFAFSGLAFSQTALVKNSFDQATAEARRGEFEKALKDYQKALTAAESENLSEMFFARLHFNIGVCQFQLGRFAEAETALTKSVNVSGGLYARAFYPLGLTETRLGKLDRAKRNFRRAIRAEDRTGEVWFDLALVHLRENDLGGAERAFQRSIENKSVSSADALNNLGVIFALTGDLEKAENYFQKALAESNGGSAEAGKNLRFCRYFKEHQTKELLAGFQFSRRERIGI